MSSPQVEDYVPPARTKGPDFPRWLQSKEAAHYLGFSSAYLRKLVTLKVAPPAVGQGRGKRYFTTELDKWLRERGGKQA